MWKVIAWEGDDWGAQTHWNLKVGHSLIHLFLPRVCVKCPSCACHRRRQTMKGRSLVRRALCVRGALSPVSGTVTLVDCPLRWCSFAYLELWVPRQDLATPSYGSLFSRVTGEQLWTTRLWLPESFVHFPMAYHLWNSWINFFHTKF